MSIESDSMPQFDPARLATLDESHDEAWQEVARLWQAGDWQPGDRPVYLNHGSFGLPPRAVVAARERWIAELNRNPMDFYLRHFEPLLQSTRAQLAEFVGTSPDNLAFVDNATYGMNVVARAFPLVAGDEVLLNDHEYGAVERIWHRRCDEVGAVVCTASLPAEIESADQVVDQLFASVTDRTRLIVISHITSPTAITLPVASICQRAQERGVAVCIDGPHAPAQVDIQLDALGCDFYTASCHKWLCATLGSGFVYVAPQWQNECEPLNKSWGRLLPNVPEKWNEEFDWSGTRDPSPLLTIGTAIEFMNRIGIENYRRRSRWLSRRVRHLLEAEFGTRSLVPDDDPWYCSMAHVPLPENPGGYPGLQHSLWSDFGIEVPIIEFQGRWFVRVSSHLYNSTQQQDFLLSCLKTTVTGTIVH